MIRFKKPKNELEGQQKVIKTPRPSVPADMCVLCPSCRKTLFNGDLLANASVCTNCGYHFRMSARERPRDGRDAALEKLHRFPRL